ncbi:3-oxoacyl-[acyl-carrier protein] reductase [Fulvivirga imtechensis AK7]|uniref:3-oxoacyl-[acyl-carrier-protein] reductase FabG n=1 Tax=Fulvivirga imtechensis AK7 TaxID=1237149 RepID=L8JT64_9BACT|nr:3-oxoacyl-ACP reductase FabG [Fulvivirga imtechensis]ELR70542.1 3-oxoacyl-[acyl-carrier protein] reductase [Fulvivirga imtechensis AK7]
MKKLKDKVAIITGGARGIGFASASKFLTEGAQVVIWDISDDAGQHALESLKGNGSISFIKVDTTSPESVVRATELVINTYKKIDILINNAGITRDATIKKMTLAEWQQVIDVNLTGVFNCTQAVVPHMIEQGAGCIINTSSVVGLYGNFGQANYAATKSGLIGMTKTLAKELGKYNITVNAVAPGFIATDMIQTIPEKVINMMVGKTPLGRLGKPEDIANAYAFLASSDAAFISGTVLSVDGAVSI